MFFSTRLLPLSIAGVMLSHVRCLLNSKRGFLHRSSTRNVMSSVRSLSSQAAESNNARATMPIDYDSPIPDTAPPQKNVYGLSHIIQYLAQIEDILQSSTSPSPAIRNNHCYENNQTFFKLIGSALAKPMLRTLIYGDVSYNDEGTNGVKSKKIHFDQRIREARISLEGKKMYAFIIDALRPAVEALDAGVRDEMVPDLLDQIEKIESSIETNHGIGWDNVPSPMNWPARTGLFNRLASGRQYRGNLESLVSDLFPELLDEYHYASQKASDREVLEVVINIDLIQEQNKPKNKKLNGNERWAEKRINAITNCLDKFYPLEDEQSSSPLSEKNDYSGEGIQSGKKCEESCITFLHKKYTEGHPNTRRRRKILQNIHVNERRNGDDPGQKYIPPKIFRKGSVPKHKKDGAGIIWTDSIGNVNGIGRHRLCSEFDAIVISRKVPPLSDSANNNEQCDGEPNNSTYIESIFEAKKTISPSSLHDILEKKLGAIQALVDNHGAELEYNDGESIETIPFSSGEGVPLTFGVYGGELQRPENAADSIRSIAGSNVVTSNIHEVICAFERDEVMVEVELMACLRIVDGLKSTIEAIQDQSQIEVLLFIEEDVDFL
mmetsp:Transcript_15663/g.28096  ORF Transcript_15663/g.28096 Transcript_15663/m.28096 type:complete len:607 (-) Transcript_15663:4264-6084(-)